MSERILIVEDEEHLREPLSDFFRAEGFAVDAAADGEQALELARAATPDCVILDVMLPKRDGLSVCRELRQAHPLLPIILLTARGAEGDRVMGLDSGADDYVTKPFGMLELAARVRAQLRRLRRSRDQAPADAADAVSFGACVLDRAKRVLTRDGAEVRLSAMELKVLEYLVEHEGAVVPRNQLLDEVWGYDRYPSTRTVDTHVWKLRQKLERDPNHPQHFLTVHGLGYRFVLEPGD